MKKLFASVSYSFNNFYNNLNVEGQIIFSIIIFLILLLCLILFIVYVKDSIKNKRRLSLIKKEEKKNIIKEEVNEKKEAIINIPKETKKEDVDKTSVSDIAKNIENAINNPKPVNLTTFEEDQEKTAIISIDELMKKAKELELIDDEDENVNYLEKYNLEPSEINQKLEEVDKKELKEVKAFRVSQVISPIYGVKKDVIEKNEEA